MRTTYSNTKHPKAVKWLCAIFLAAGIAAFVTYITTGWQGRLWLMFAAYILMETPLFIQSYYLTEFIIDEEKDTFLNSQNKKYPLHISDLATVTYEENRKGKFRTLFLRDKGVGFSRIRTSRENAEHIVAQLTAANPSIEVLHKRK